jgi:hypothetical protein
MRLPLPLWRHDGIFGCFCHAESHHFLGRDLDGFSGGRIPPHACFPVHAHQPSNSRDHEYAVLLNLGNGGLGKVLQHPEWL